MLDEGQTTYRLPDDFPEDWKAALVPALQGFAFIRRLGKGAFGEVWLARDLTLQVDRAVKLLAADRDTAENTVRLLEEGRKMAALPRHPNRVQVHAFIAAGARCFLVMEYVPGGSLDALVAPDRPMPWERAARYVADVGDALADLHARGILHRDVKPANILRDSDRDEALLGDYGIAACFHEGGIAGTRGYIAPEVIDGRASPRSDVFSLAATLYHLLVGRPPFAAPNLMATLALTRKGLPRPAAELANVPEAVEEVLRAGLEPDPDRRADLPTFVARLRGAHLQGLADRLLELARRTPSRVRLSVQVSTAREPDLVFRPVACQTQPARTRNFAFVPEPAPVAAARTGDLLRLEITADADGHLTVLNLGSSGDVEVVFPNPQVRDDRVRAGLPQRLTVQLTPPAGTDRAAVIWTRRPSGLTPAEWRRRMEGGSGTATARALTRGMDFVLHEAAVHPPDEWTAEVVTIAHA